MACLLVLIAVTSISHEVVVHIPLGARGGEDTDVHNQGRRIVKPCTPSSRAKIFPELSWLSTHTPLPPAPTPAKLFRFSGLESC